MTVSRREVLAVGGAVAGTFAAGCTSDDEASSVSYLFYLRNEGELSVNVTVEALDADGNAYFSETKTVNDAKTVGPFDEEPAKIHVEVAEPHHDQSYERTKAFAYPEETCSKYVETMIVVSEGSISFSPRCTKYR